MAYAHAYEDLKLWISDFYVVTNELAAGANEIDEPLGWRLERRTLLFGAGDVEVRAIRESGSAT